MGSSNGSSARRLAASLMPIMPASRQRSDLGQRLVGVVGIDRDVAPDPVGMLALEGEHRVVAVAQVGERRKIRGRGLPPAPENGGDVGGDAHALPRTQPAGVPLPPVGARGAVVQEVRVNVDQHARLPLVPLVVVGHVGSPASGVARSGRPHRAPARSDRTLGASFRQPSSSSTSSADRPSGFLGDMDLPRLRGGRMRGPSGQSKGDRWLERQLLEHIASRSSARSIAASSCARETKL